MKGIGISGRLYALVGIALAAMLATGIYAILQERSALLAERQLMLSSMTESANSVFAAYHEMETQGLLTRDEAQSLAKQAVGAMRYQKVEYFFAFDVNHRIVFHPTRPAGQDLTDYQDSSGLYLYREMV